MDYICSKDAADCEFYDLGKCHNVEDCAYAIANNVKRSPFKHREAIQLAHDMEHNNTYANALIVENKSLRKDRDQWKVAAEAGRDVIQPMLRKRIDELEAENIELKAERDALVKSIRIVSEPIETIQPRGIVE